MAQLPHSAEKRALIRSTWRLWRGRLAWMVLIWLLSVAALGLAAALMRLVMQMLGMR